MPACDYGMVNPMHSASEDRQRDYLFAERRAILEPVASRGPDLP